MENATRSNRKTYKVRLAGHLSGKRFRDSVNLIKEAGGTFDEASKIWTVTAREETSAVRPCGPCGGTGRPALSVSADGDECPGNCDQYGPHKHDTRVCDNCRGEGSLMRLDTPRELAALRTLERVYDAQVTAADDGGRAQLEDERRRLLARVDEIGKLLA